jgi:hypothetical protein
VRKRYGKLVVLRRVDRDDGVVLYECRCDCGKIKRYWKSNVVRGKSTSCGCSHLERKSENSPMKGHVPMTEESKKNAKSNYLSGNLPRWMYS